MPYYRIYLIDEAGHIVNFHELIRDTDADALASARTFLANWPTVEVWNATQLVTRLAG
jgi:hypothetical protein